MIPRFHGDTHIAPIDDLQEHELEGTGCQCNPRIEVNGAGLLIIHNAYDNREFFEELNELLETKSL